MGPEMKAGVDDSGPAWPSQRQWECTEESERESDTVSGYFEQFSGYHVKKQRRNGGRETRQGHCRCPGNRA